MNHTVRFALAVILSAILLLAFLWAVAPRVNAARTQPTCGWSGTTLWAEDLPDEWSLTREPYPIGVHERPSSFSADFGEAFTAYFWTRGGGKGLFHPGRQLNDYKPICVAVP